MSRLHDKRVTTCGIRVRTGDTGLDCQGDIDIGQYDTFSCTTHTFSGSVQYREGGDCDDAICFPQGTACDPQSCGTSVVLVEVCDGVDNNGNGVIDEGLFCGPIGAGTPGEDVPNFIPECDDTSLTGTALDADLLCGPLQSLEDCVDLNTIDFANLCWRESYTGAYVLTTGDCLEMLVEPDAHEFLPSPFDTCGGIAGGILRTINRPAVGDLGGANGQAELDCVRQCNDWANEICDDSTCTQGERCQCWQGRMELCLIGNNGPGGSAPAACGNSTVVAEYRTNSDATEKRQRLLGGLRCGSISIPTTGTLASETFTFCRFPNGKLSSLGFNGQ